MHSGKCLSEFTEMTFSLSVTNVKYIPRKSKKNPTWSSGGVHLLIGEDFFFLFILIRKADKQFHV